MSTPDAPRKKVLGARGAILLVVVGAMLFSSAYPLGRYIGLQHEVAALKELDARMDATIDALQEERASLLTDAEVERLARERLGYVKPGEVPYAIAESSPRIEAPAADILVDDVPPGDGLFTRWWGAMKVVVTAR